MAATDRFNKLIKIGSRVRWQSYDRELRAISYQFGIVKKISEERKVILTVDVVNNWSDLVNKVTTNDSVQIAAKQVAVV